MSHDTSIFNINPYYDDFDPAKSFLRVMFKPGYAVQARELTTLQSILQNQISNIGDHLFKDGSRIIGGSISVRNCQYIMVKVGNGTNFSGISDYSFVDGGTVSGASVESGLANISHYIPPDSTDGNLILVLDFVSGSSFPTTETLTFTSSDGTATFTMTQEQQSWGRGLCKLVNVTDGIFYINGFFVQIENQFFSPFRTVGTSYRDLTFTSAGTTTTFDSLSRKIGFTITRDSITENQDPSLRDPAIGSYNYNAPGADRFKISAMLDQTETLEEEPEDFIELLRFENGKITKKSESITYAELEKTLARRTYDESGSYTVRPFEIEIKDMGLDENKMSVTISPGKAYVYGHELETSYPQTFTVDKARTITTETNLSYPQHVGSYIGVCADITNFGTTLSTFLPTISNGSALVEFRNSSGAKIGEARVHGMLPTGFVASTGITSNKYNLYLYGVCAGSVIGGASSGIIRQHGTGFTLAVITPSIGNVAAPVFQQPQRPNDISLVYPIEPGYAIRDFQNIKFTGKVVTGNITVTHNPTDNSTNYFIPSSSVAEVINAGSALSGEFRFKSYGTNNSSFADTKHIQFLKNGLLLCPAYRVGQGITLSREPDGAVSMTIANSNLIAAPFGFTSGSIRAVLPFEYDVNTFNSSTVRVKESAQTSETFTSLLTDIDGRKYVRLNNIDVYSVVSVVKTADNLNISSDWELDDGQKDTFYDLSRLYLKPSKVNQYGVVPSFRVTYDYFQHKGFSFAPFVGSHSYPQYKSIPLYTSKRTGKTVSLANCIDFRHSGSQNPSAIAKPYGASEEFGSSEYTFASYSHYLPRIDKIKLTTNPTDNSATFVIDSGEPDMSPIAPPDAEESLTLYSITVPAYTHNSRDVLITPYDNKRYTMADIGKMEKRMDEIEVFAKLTASEQDIASRTIAPILGVAAEPIKTSFYVDSFFGHGGADVVSPNHICSIDYENGEMRPFFTHLPLQLSAIPTASGTTLSSDGLLTLNYLKVPYITHGGYTDRVKINPSRTVNWMGFLTLPRPIETAWDYGYRPFIRTNTLSENDNWIASNANAQEGFGTHWNDWESYWTGIEDKEEEYDSYKKKILELPKTTSTSFVPNMNTGSLSVGVSRNQKLDNELIQEFVNSKNMRNHIRTRVGKRIIDKTVSPYIPSKSFVVTAHGLKPSTPVYLFMDGVLLSSTSALTDTKGSCTISFLIPPNTFLAGEKTIRISDNANPQNCTTAAEAIYYCGGIFTQRDSGSYSTRPPVLRRQTVTSEGIIKDPFNRDVSYDDIQDSVENNQWIDPLAQTFFVDKKTNPYGVFLKNITLYFSEKDSTLPVSVQIRPTVNGYPSPSVIIPFTTVVKQASEVTVARQSGTNTPIGTVFEFSSPVYLEPDEYAITVIANSSKYSLYSIQAGLPLSNGGRAGSSPLVGSLFLPQSVGTAIKNNIMDLAFSMERCDFYTNSFGNLSYGVVGWAGAQVAKIYTPEIIPSGCSITRTFDGKPLFNNQNIWPTSTISSSINPYPQLIYNLTRGISTHVSPVVDLGAVFGIAAKMRLSSTVDDSSGYVTKAVTLPDDNLSSGLLVLADTCVPSGSDILVYYRYSSNGESDLFDMPWIPMTEKSAFTSATELDFREGRWVATASNIRTYQIRVVMTGSGSEPYNKTPAVRNLRVVSFR
jgi:hypothetical protein